MRASHNVENISGDCGVTVTTAFNVSTLNEYGGSQPVEG
jgi:hypothetical protein